MSVLPPPLGRDSPMSIERIAPANQFHPQNTNNPLQSAHNDRCSVATDGGGDGDVDGDVEMRPPDNRHPPSSACTLLVCFSFVSGTLSPCVRVGERARLRIYVWHLSPGARSALTELLHHPMTSRLPPFRSVPIAHSHDTSSQTGRSGEQQASKQASKQAGKQGRQS